MNEGERDKNRDRGEYEMEKGRREGGRVVRERSQEESEAEAVACTYIGYG